MSRENITDPGPLFRRPPVVHRHDPVTSHEASAAISATRETHVARMVVAVHEHPGLSAVALAEIVGLPLVETRRRLSDGKARGLIRRGVPVREPGRAVRQSTWWPVTRPASTI